MALITGTIKLTGAISPTDTTDTYPSHIDIYGKGGFHSVDDLAGMSGITTQRRKEGMMVYVISESKTYQLQGGTGDTAWTVFSGAGATSGIHNDLTGLQGGSAGQYYHLTSAQNTALTTGANADSYHVHSFSNITSTGHTHDIGNITGFDPADYTTDSEFSTHTGDSSIHFTVASLNLSQYTTDSEFSTHTGNTGIHFTEASIDHGSIGGLLDNDHPQYRLTATTINFSEIGSTGHTHAISDVTNLQTELNSRTTDSEFTTHTGNSGIHFTVASLNLSQYTTDSEFTTHTGNSGIHFTEASIDIDNIVSGHNHTVSEITDISSTLADYTTDSEFSTHTGDSSIHFTVGSLNLSQYTTDSEFTTHTGDSTIHFTEGSIDHTNIQNIGTNSHTAIDTHIDSSPSIHFTEGSIDHGSISGLLDDDHPQYATTGDVTTLTSSVTTHTGDSTIHFTVASLNLSQYTTDSEHTTHTGDSTIHFTEASIDFANISNTGHSHTVSDITDLASTLNGYTTDSEFSTHTGDGTIHFTVSEIWDSASSAHTHDASEILYTNSTPLEVAHGGLSAGTTFNATSLKDILDDILYPYQTPSFASFSIAGAPSTTEVGSTVLVGSQDFTWTFNNSQNLNTTSLDIYDVTNTTYLETNISTTSPHSYDFGAGITENTETTRTWRAYATDTNSTEFQSGNETVSWRWRIYYGSGSSTMTASEISGLTNSNLDTTFVDTSNGYDMEAGNYKWIAYPSSWGTAVEFTDKSTMLEVPMVDSYTDTITNQHGQSTTYRIHRTLNSLGGAVTILVS